MSDDKKAADHSSPAKGVGYKSPPVHSQFKKGQSGNPKGRPRKQYRQFKIADPDEILAEVLSESLKVTSEGRKRSRLKEYLIMSRLVNEAITGDIAAIRFVMERLYRMPGQYKNREMRFFRWTDEDEENSRQFTRDMKEFLEQENELIEEAKKAGKPPPTPHDVLDRLESKGLMATNEEALKGLKDID